MQVDLNHELASVGASKNYCNVYIRFKIKSESYVENLKTCHLLLGPSNQVHRMQKSKLTGACIIKLYGLRKKRY